MKDARRRFPLTAAEPSRLAPTCLGAPHETRGLVSRMGVGGGHVRGPTHRPNDKRPVYSCQAPVTYSVTSLSDESHPAAALERMVDGAGDRVDDVLAAALRVIDLLPPHELEMPGLVDEDTMAVV